MVADTRHGSRTTKTISGKTSRYLCKQTDITFRKQILNKQIKYTKQFNDELHNWLLSLLGEHKKTIFKL